MKYEFVPGDEKIIAPGRVVKRIRTVIAIAALGLPSGALGGYIESERNLEVSGDAWVSGNAWVYGNAQVSGDARVYGDARVSGNAQVSGNARVSGNAQVSGDARVYGDARVSGNAQVSGDGLIFWASKVGTQNGTLTVFAGKYGELLATRGCFIGNINQFLAKSKIEHDDATHLEYRLLIEVAHSRITRALATTQKPL